MKTAPRKRSPGIRGEVALVDAHKVYSNSINLSEKTIHSIQRIIHPA
jgi:hypothetical protein